MVVLRIKRVYFDAIMSGTKTREYRKQSSYYDRLLARVPRPSLLKLHYQCRERQLIADIIAINLIDCPWHLKREEGWTEKVYEIKLRHPRYVTNRQGRRFS